MVSNYDEKIEKRREYYESFGDLKISLNKKKTITISNKMTYLFGDSYNNYLISMAPYMNIDNENERELKYEIYYNEYVTKNLKIGIEEYLEMYNDKRSGEYMIDDLFKLNHNYKEIKYIHEKILNFVKPIVFLIFPGDYKNIFYGIKMNEIFLNDLFGIQKYAFGLKNEITDNDILELVRYEIMESWFYYAVQHFEITEKTVKKIFDVLENMSYQYRVNNVKNYILMYIMDNCVEKIDKKIFKGYTKREMIEFIERGNEYDKDILKIEENINIICNRYSYKNKDAIEKFKYLYEIGYEININFINELIKYDQNDLLEFIKKDINSSLYDYILLNTEVYDFYKKKVFEKLVNELRIPVNKDLYKKILEKVIYTKKFMEKRIYIEKFCWFIETFVNEVPNNFQNEVLETNLIKSKKYWKSLKDLNEFKNIIWVDDNKKNIELLIEYIKNDLYLI